MNTIATQSIQHDGFDIRIDVVQDEGETPFGADCYDAADIAAWRNDEWIFVGYVYTASRFGIELGTASIWGSAWDYPGSIDSIDAWIAEDYYHPDMLAEVTAEARASLARLVSAD